MEYGINRGASSLMQALLGGAGVRDRATADELATMQTGRYRAAQAKKADTEAAIKADRLQALQGLSGVLAPILAAQGLDPAHSENYAGVLRAGQGNADAMAGGVTKFATGARQQQAVNEFRGGNRELANIMLSASGRTPYSPYSQNAGGSVLNEATGGVDQSNPMAQGSIGAIMALAAERAAGARQNDATANLRQAEIITEGLRPDLVRAQTSKANAGAIRDYAATGPGGADATTQARKQAELEGQGLPTPIARGVAYGTINMVKDAMGLSTRFVDIATGTTVAELDAKGNLITNENVYAPGAPARGTAPNDPLGIRGG